MKKAISISKDELLNVFENFSMEARGIKECCKRISKENDEEAALWVSMVNNTADIMLQELAILKEKVSKTEVDGEVHIMALLFSNIR